MRYSEYSAKEEEGGEMATVRHDSQMLPELNPGEIWTSQ